MREQGIGTLISPVVERRKMAVRVEGKEETMEGRRRLSAGGFPTSFHHGAKYLDDNNNNNGNGLFQSNNIRFKEGNATSMQTTIRINNSNGGKPQHHNIKEVIFRENCVQREASAAETEASGGLKRKLSAEDDMALLQWGRRKRSRYNNRLEPSKHAGGALIPEESVSKTPSPKEDDSSSNPLFGSDPQPKPRCQAPLPKPKSALLADAPASRNGGAVKVGNNSTSSIHEPTKEAAASSPSQRKVTDNNGSSKQQQQQQKQKQKTMESSMDPPPAVAAGGGGGSHGVGGSFKNKKTAMAMAMAMATTTTTTNDASKADTNQTVEWPRFVLNLSRKEKEEDFLIFKGSKLPQRPKKRTKTVEKTLIYCTPGNWLSDLYRGRYDVREKKCTKKKPRGLKAMESLESDSD